MRISETFNHDTYLRYLKQTQQSLDGALARMASGKRVQYASDDPAAAAELGRLSDEAQKLTARRNGLSAARPWLQMTEQAATALGDNLRDALTDAVQGASGTLQQSQRDALAEQVAGLRQQVQGLTNTQVAGRYIFSGTRTDQAPYQNGVYVGNQSTIQIPLDDGTTPINLPATQVFGDGTSGPVKLLGDLETALRTGTAADVQALLDPLRAAISSNAATLAKIGNYRKALEDADVRMQDRQLQVSTRLGDLGAADMAAAISDVTQLQQAHQATLAAGARLFGPTFFDYLG